MLDAEAMAGLLKGDLVQFRCNDMFVAQRRLNTKPILGLELARELIHPSMGELVNCMACTILYPPVVKCDTLYRGNVKFDQYQRLEWPTMLYGQGYIKVNDRNNDCTIRIQAAKSVDPVAVKFKMTERGREMLLKMANMNNYEIAGVNQAVLWANTNDLIRSYHQADIRTEVAPEPMEDDIIIDDIVVNIDSGRGSSLSRSAQPTPEAAPRVPVVPIPSARVPSPVPENDDLPTTVDGALGRITDVVEQLQRMYERTMGDVHQLQRDMHSMKDCVASKVR